LTVLISWRAARRAEALDKVRARFLVISFESDWLYPPSQSRDLVRLLKRHNLAVTYLNLPTPYGHDSFFDPQTRNFPGR